jgi:hypothetical protein
MSKFVLFPLSEPLELADGRILNSLKLGPPDDAAFVTMMARFEALGIPRGITGLTIPVAAFSGISEADAESMFFHDLVAASDVVAAMIEAPQPLTTAKDRPCRRGFARRLLLNLGLSWNGKRSRK